MFYAQLKPNFPSVADIGSCQGKKSSDKEKLTEKSFGKLCDCGNSPNLKKINQSMNLQVSNNTTTIEAVDFIASIRISVLCKQKKN